MSSDEFKALDRGMKEVLAYVRGEGTLTVHEVDVSTPDGGIVRRGRAFRDPETRKPIYEDEAPHKPAHVPTASRGNASGAEIGRRMERGKVRGERTAIRAQDRSRARS